MGRGSLGGALDLAERYMQPPTGIQVASPLRREVLRSPLSEQDQDTAQVDEAEKIERVALITDHEPTEVAKALAKSRSTFHRRLYRCRGWPSCVLGRLRLRRCGAIISTPNAASPASSGWAS